MQFVFKRCENLYFSNHVCYFPSVLQIKLENNVFSTNSWNILRFFQDFEGYWTQLSEHREALFRNSQILGLRGSYWSFISPLRDAISLYILDTYGIGHSFEVRNFMTWSFNSFESNWSKELDLVKIGPTHQVHYSYQRYPHGATQIQFRPLETPYCTMRLKIHGTN